MSQGQQKQAALNSMSLMLFFENMSILLSSGISIEDCLKLMEQDAGSDRDRVPIVRLREALGETFYLHEAMNKVGFFPAYAVSMCRVGEHSGNLEKICASLADYYEQENQRNAQIKGAVMNPFILICIMAVVIAFLVNAILPVFSNVYAQMGINIDDDKMISIALTIGSVAMWVILGVLALLIVGSLYYMTSSGRAFFQKLMENSFLTRNFHTQLALARFTSTFGMLVASGEDVAASLELAADACQNTALRQKLAGCITRVQAGDPLAAVFTESGIFNPTHNGILSSGIRSGATPKVMERLSEIYEQNTSRMIESFLSLIEPLMIGVLSVIIGIILICIMLPLIGILSSIG